MRILFIDDRSEEMQIHKRTLEKKGYKVEIESNLDAAFQNLKEESNQIKYDLVFIDEDFEKTKRQSNIKSGEELIIQLKPDKIICPIVYFSAVMNSISTVTKILGQLGVCYFFDKNIDFDGKQEKCIKKVVNLPNYSRIIELRSNRINAELSKFFNSLDEKEAFTWQQEVANGADADWSTFNAVAFGEKYRIDELLYNPVNPLSKEEKSKAINDFIQETRRIPNLSKTFLKDAEDQLKWYLNLPENDLKEAEKDIDHYAHNYFLNALLVATESTIMEAVYSLNNRNVGISRATEKINKRTLIDNQKKQLFIQKMALRRVAGLFYYYSVRNTTFEFDPNLIACLLKSGKTHIDDRYDSEYNDQKIVWNWLGLTTTSLNMIISEYNPRINGYSHNNPFSELFFSEEAEWIRSLVCSLTNVRKCLDDIYQEIKNVNSSYLPISDSEFFSDLADFKTWYSESILKLRSNSLQEIGDIKNIIKSNATKNDVQAYFCKYYSTSITHFGAGRLGLGLVAPIINQLGDKIVIINRFSQDWQNCRNQEFITIECNGVESKYKFYHQELSNVKKEEIRNEWEDSCKMKLIVAVDYENSNEIGFFLKDAQHITTSLKSGLRKAKQIVEETNFNNLVTIYPFENNKQDVYDFYKDLNDDQFEKSLLIADRVCTHTELNPELNKLLVYAENYGNVVINGTKVGNNLFKNQPKIKGIDYIFCEDKDEFEFHFSKKFRILNCVHASLAVMCYDKVMDKIPKDKWGEQYVSLLNDGKIKSDIEKVATAEILKLVATTDKDVLSRVFPSKELGEVYNELKKYSNTIFDRFDNMADRLDRVLNLDDLIDKFDARIDDTINFFDGSNDDTINTIVNEIPEANKPNIKEINKTLRELLIQVSKVNRKRNG